MKIKTLSDRFLHFPNRRNGASVFSGKPLATQEVYDLIKAEGIDFISQNLTKLIEMRKEMFGNAKVDYYGMYQTQLFFDLKKRVAIRVKELIDSPAKDFSLEVFDDLFPKLQKDSNIKVYKSIKQGIMYSSMD